MAIGGWSEVAPPNDLGTSTTLTPRPCLKALQSAIGGQVAVLSAEVSCSVTAHDTTMP